MQNLSNEVIGDVSPVENVHVHIWMNEDNESIVGIDEETRQETCYTPDPALRQEALEIEADWREINEALFEAGDLQVETGSSEPSVTADESGQSNLSLKGNAQSFLSFMQSITGSSNSDALVPESTVNQELLETLNSRLKPQHLEDLRKSGLSDEMIDKMGCVSLWNYEIHEKIYGNQDYSSKWNGATGYSIPYADSNGQTTLTRYRIFWTEQALENDPKLPKYMSPQKAATQIYVPHGFSGIKADYVIVTEGEKKAAKAVQEGFPCVALAGVDMWADSAKRKIEKENGQHLSYSSKMHPKLIELAKTRKVIVLFDSDAHEKPQVAAARTRVKDAFLFQGAEWCRVMSMPTLEWQKNEKVGLDDLLLCSAGKGLLKKKISEYLLGETNEMSPLFEFTYSKKGKKSFRYVVENICKSKPDAKIIKECPDEDGGVEERTVSSTLVWVSKAITSIDGDGYKYYELSFVPHDENIPKSITGDGNILNVSTAKDDQLTLFGAKVLPKYKAQLEEFFIDCIKQGVAREVVSSVFGTKRRGWRKADEYFNEPCYLTGSALISQKDIFQASEPTIPIMPLDCRSDEKLRQAMSKQGDFNEWCEAIGTYVVPSPLPCLVLAASFCGLLRHWCEGSENFILHAYGTSSAGKTLMLKAAASAWGNPKHLIDSWKATVNGLERKAVSRNGMAMFLDEAGTADEKLLEEAVYMIGNGGEKTRATKDAGVRSTTTFEVVAISTGEKVLMQGDKHAGQEVRALEIATDGKSRLWLTFNGPEGAESLERIFLNNFGHAVTPMVQGILKSIANDSKALTRVFSRYLEALRQESGAGLPPHINRRLKHFALCLTSLQLLLVHVLKWDDELVQDQIEITFHYIVSNLVRLETDQNAVSEDYKFLQHFNSQIAIHQQKFLNDAIEDQHLPTVIYGEFKDGKVWCIRGKLKELTAPHDEQRFIAIAKKHGILVMDQPRKNDYVSHRIGNYPKPDCYPFSLDRLNAYLEENAES